MMIHFMKIPAVLVLLKMYNDYFPLLNEFSNKCRSRILIMLLKCEHAFYFT